MKKFLSLLGFLGVLSVSIPQPCVAADAAPAPERTIQERLEDLEAYVNNGARNATTNALSKVAGPGPGHNAWQMTSSALVLFMTLPGLALFYGTGAAQECPLGHGSMSGHRRPGNHLVVGVWLQSRLLGRQAFHRKPQ
jgi:hypothetical protein